MLWVSETLFLEEAEVGRGVVRRGVTARSCVWVLGPTVSAYHAVAVLLVDAGGSIGRGDRMQVCWGSCQLKGAMVMYPTIMRLVSSACCPCSSFARCLASDWRGIVERFVRIAQFPTE